ncbi:MAG: tRNA (adenosine(37)-N6)-threonylcarbamoyltransferase complex dimerization subunit type 1 TsaB [Planctomycetaceae bacterium]
MRILAVETSGVTGGVALLHDTTVLAERPLLREGRRHAGSLVKEADEILRSAGCPPSSVDVVAVSIGPGSFTGLRVGVVFAKTWCYVTGAKLVAVDTLQAAAEQAPPDVERIFAVADAQRGDLYVGEYRRADDGTASAGPIAIVHAGEFTHDRSAGDFVTGAALDRHASLFADRCRLASPSERCARAVTVARMGRRSAAAGEFADFWTIEPFYVRKSAAEEKRDAAENA